MLQFTNKEMINQNAANGEIDLFKLAAILIAPNGEYIMNFVLN